MRSRLYTIVTMAAACGPISLVAMSTGTACNSAREQSRPADSRPTLTNTTTATAATSTRPPHAEAPPPHGLRDEQLNQLMQRISAKTEKYWPEDVPRPRDDQKAGDLAKASESAHRLADALASAAERIPASVERVPMTEADRAGFMAEATTFGAQALRLRQAASEQNSDGIRAALDSITATCVSCHARYRDFAGDLQVQQVNAEQSGMSAPPPFVVGAAFR